MFFYYLRLALSAFQKNVLITLLMILAIGFGVGASMTTYAVFKAVSGDPIPGKSTKLFIPQIDIWGPGMAQQTNGQPPDALSYIDAKALISAHKGRHESPIYPVSPSVVPHVAQLHPINIDGHAVYGDFFSMLDVPFVYGSGWGAEDDKRHAPVATISSSLNNKLFAGINSVGKTINLDGREYTIMGVMGDWSPQPRYYDVINTGGFSSKSDDVFIPFNHAIDVEMPINGTVNCSVHPTEPGIQGLRNAGGCAWISYMVELDDPLSRDQYSQFLYNYSKEQQYSGRFNWAPNNRLRDLPAWLDFQHVVPSDTKVSLFVAIGLLVVCLVNTAGLLNAKLSHRRGEVAVRRALGAPLSQIYKQFLTEAGTIGAAGGLLGIIFTVLGVRSIGWVLPKNISDIAHVDLPLLVLTLIVAIVSTLLAGMYPTFSASRVQPALQLKAG